MPSPATTWLHVSGYRFLLRRIECALLFGDVCAATGALRARTTSLALGCVLAIVAAMGCAFVALLRPQSALGQAPIVMGRESGALYVRVDDVWHPVLNLASARLIAATNANPQPVSESELGHTKRGPLLGIPGAPQLLDQPLAGAESAWAICDSDNGGSTTVVVGPAEDSSAQVLTAEQMILVATESGSPTYLLYGGRRAVVDLADPASVTFDAVDKGIAAGADVVLIDTAGRLHTKVGLMDELDKVKRVVTRRASVDEVLLVLDATIGQNGLAQARVFAEVVDISGAVLTKLDGTAKGGIVFRVQQELGVPVKLVGLGEGPDDLAPFEPAAFVDALLG